jgi:hypothetical protein
VVLGEAASTAERMAELQRLAPALWGLAEAALLESDVDKTALAWCEQGLSGVRAGPRRRVLLSPFLVTGTRPGCRRVTRWRPPGG